jgi:hypothetical protein
MATVKITRELIEKVQGNARNVHGAKIHALHQSADLCGWTGDKLLQLAYGTELLAQLRSPAMAPFVRTVTDIQLESLNGLGVGRNFPLTAPTPFVTGRGVAFPIKRDDEDVGLATLTNPYSSTTGYMRLQLPSDMLNGLDVESRRVREAQATLRAVQEDYLVSVRKVLESFTTLAPALKAWPALWELLPFDVKERHKEVREKSAPAAKPAAPEVDLDKLTAITAAHRLGL